MQGGSTRPKLMHDFGQVYIHEKNWFILDNIVVTVTSLGQASCQGQ